MSNIDYYYDIYQPAKKAYEYRKYIPYALAAGKQAYDLFKSRSLDNESDQMEYETGGNGLSLKRARTAYGGRKKMKIMKLIKANIKPVKQVLNVWNHTGSVISSKHPVSEQAIGTGGFMGIAKDSQANCTPMHVYDLNYFIGATNDNQTNWPISGTTQNGDVNCRAWFFANTNKFEPHRSNASGLTKPTSIGANVLEHRYTIDDADETNLAANPSSKVFRKSICINYMLYGTTRQTMMYDIRVIRVTNPIMCPDYPTSLTAEDLKVFQQNWQNMIRAYTINPMLKGVEPGPQSDKPWFKTIAKKRVTIAEQTSEVDNIGQVMGKMYIKLNEVNDYAWGLQNFNVESGDATFDTIPDPDDNGSNNTFRHKPYYTSRYYLVIRSIGTIDQWSNVGGQDGINPNNPGGDDTVPDTEVTAYYEDRPIRPKGWAGFYEGGLYDTGVFVRDGVGVPTTINTSTNALVQTQGSYDLCVRTYFLQHAGI